MSGNKETRQLVVKVRKHGWTAEYTKGDHIRLIPPDGDTKRSVVIANTPSDARAIKNVLALLRRHGLKDRPQRRRKD